MGVVSVHNHEVQYGRDEDAIAIVRDSKPIVERLGVGLEGFRLWHWTTAGPRGAHYALGVEYADRASYAATLANEAADDEFQEWAKRLTAPDSPLRPIGHTIQNDLLPVIGSEAGSVGWVAIMRVKPGRQEELKTLVRTGNMLLLEAGALRTTYRTIGVGGPLTGSVVQVAEYADMASWAESAPGSDRLSGNAEWQDLVQTTLGPHGPVIVDSLRINLLTEIEL